MSGNTDNGDVIDVTHSKYVSTVLSIESYASDETPQSKAHTQYLSLSPHLRVPKRQTD